jgi:hypothetical protein
MEHAIRGQIGQPAACMMDSKSLSAQMKQRAIMTQLAAGFSSQTVTLPHTPSTSLLAHKICG